MADKLFDGLDNTFVISDTGDVIESSPKGTAITKDKSDETTVKSKQDTVINQDDLIDTDDEITTDTNKTNTTTTTNSDNNTDPAKEGFKMLATRMKENGFLVDEVDITDFDGEEDNFWKLVEKSDQIVNERALKESIKDLDPRLQDIILKAREGVDLEALLEAKKGQIKYSKIDVEKLGESENLQEEIYKDYLKKTTRFSDDKITKEIKRIKDLGELEDEVKAAVPELKKMEELQEQELVRLNSEQQEAFRKKHEETINAYKTNIDKLEEIAPGIKISKKEKEGLFKSITTPVAQDDQGNPMSELAVERAKDPFSFDIKLHYLMKLTKGFSDFSALIKAGENSGIKKLEETLSNTKIKVGKAQEGGLGEAMQSALKRLANKR